jgi:hypothetical protein
MGFEQAVVGVSPFFRTAFAGEKITYFKMINL